MNDLASDPAPSVHASPHRVILASAGAGKTYALTGRYIALLLAGVDASTVLATTFTRKAAGEILAKTVQRLHAASDPASPHELDGLNRQLTEEGFAPTDAAACRRVLAELGRKLDRLSVSTLDAFFARLIGAFRYELGLPLEPRYLDDTSAEAAELRSRAIEAMLSEEARREASLATLSTLLKQLHHDGARRSVTDAIDRIVFDLYELYREAPDAEAWGRLHTPHLLPRERLEAAAIAVREAAQELSDKRQLNAVEKDLSQAEAELWDAFVDGGMAGKIAAGETSYYKPIPDALVTAYRPLVDHARSVALQRLSFQSRATHELLRLFDERFTELRNARGVMRFADATHALSRELFELEGDVLMDAFFRLDARVQHLLLDEFQDTSIEQWRVLEPFAEEATSQDRSFFCVGDPKQAIYGWRGGEAALFDRVQALPGLTQANLRSLAKSYRSSQVVLDAVNEVFAHLSSNPVLSEHPSLTEAWRERFETHRAAKDLPGHVTLRTTRHEPDDTKDQSDPEEDESFDDASREHERAAADFIEALQQQAPTRSIGVLVRKNRVASRLLYELRRRGLTVSGEGGVPITDAPAVGAMLSALTLADHPGHSAAAFHVVNSPLGPALGLETRQPADVERFARSVRAALLRDGYAATLAIWSRRVEDHCSDKSLRRLDRLVDLAEEFDAGSSDLRPSRFVRHAEAARVEEPAASQLRVMTIHKSKGLEFDAVVLPELDAAFRFLPTVLIQRDAPTGSVTAVHRAGDTNIRALSPELRSLADEAKTREINEWLCLLYVAMTRARHALHLLVPPPVITKKGEAGRGWTDLSYAALLRHALLGTTHDPRGEQEGQTLVSIGSDRWCVAEPSEEPSATEEEPPTSPRLLPRGLGLASSPARRGLLRTSPSSVAGNTRTAEDILASSAAGSDGRREGTLWHAMFEAVGFLDEQEPSRDSLRAQLQTTSIPLTAEEEDELTRRFLEVIRTQEVREALSRRGATELLRERPFAVFDDEHRLMTGRFDRVAIQRTSANGSAALGDRSEASAENAVVIDFKTDHCSEAELADRVAHHRPQMEAYRRAAAARWSIPLSNVTAELVFTRIGRVVRVA